MSVLVSPPREDMPIGLRTPGEWMLHYREPLMRLFAQDRPEEMRCRSDFEAASEGFHPGFAKFCEIEYLRQAAREALYVHTQ